MNAIAPPLCSREWSAFAACQSLLVATAVSVSAAAPVGPTPQQRQQMDQKAIVDGQKKLADDTKAQEQIQRDAQLAAATLQQARTKAYQDASVRLGLPKVQSDANTARIEVERLTKELTKTTKEQAEYQQAVKDADAAREKLTAVRDDKSLSEEDRRKQTDDLSKTLRAPADLIRTKIDTDSAMQEARKTLSAAQAELTNLQRQVATEAQKDTALAGAAKAAQDATDKQTKAKADLDKQQQAVVAAQGKLAQDQQQAQQQAQQQYRRPAAGAGGAMAGGAKGGSSTTARKR